MVLLPDPDFEKKANYLAVKPNSYVSIPFAKSNGGDTAKCLNQFTLSFELMVDRLPRKDPMSLLLLSREQKSVSSANVRRRVGDFFLLPDGSLSLKRSSGSGKKVSANEWAFVTLVVDCINSSCMWYIDGKACDSSASKDLLYKDGPLSIGPGGFGLFKSGNPKEMMGGNLRRMYLHTEALRPEQVEELHKELPKGSTKVDVRKQLLKLGYNSYNINDAIAECGENLAACLDWMRYMGYDVNDAW